MNDKDIYTIGSFIRFFKKRHPPLLLPSVLHSRSGVVIYCNIRIFQKITKYSTRLGQYFLSLNKVYNVHILYNMKL